VAYLTCFLVPVCASQGEKDAQFNHDSLVALAECEQHLRDIDARIDKIQQDIDESKLESRMTRVEVLMSETRKAIDDRNNLLRGIAVAVAVNLAEVLIRFILATRNAVSIRTRNSRGRQAP
jgi:hypothetical protein